MIDLHPDADDAAAAAADDDDDDDVDVTVESDEEPPELTDSDDSDDSTGCNNQLHDDLPRRKVVADSVYLSVRPSCLRTYLFLPACLSL